MSHRTYRHVDTPVAYLGLNWRQWLLIVVCAAAAVGVVDLAHPSTPLALWLVTVLVGTPVSLSYFATGSQASLGRMLLDHAGWLLGPCELPAAGGVERVRARGFMLGTPPRSWWPGGLRRERSCASSADMLGLEALAQDGVGVLCSGALVRWFEVSPVNPLLYDSDDADALSAALAQVAARLEDGQSLQMLARATPLALDATLARDREINKAAVRRAAKEGQGDLGVAMGRLCTAQEQSIRTNTQALAAMHLRYFVVCPWMPPRERMLALSGHRRRGPLFLSPGSFERAFRQSALHTSGVRGDLEAAGMSVREMRGSEVAELLRAAFTASMPLASVAPLVLPASLAELDTPESAREHAVALRRWLCPLKVDLRDRQTLATAGGLLQTRYLGSLPEQTWLGWLLLLMGAPRPWSLSVHVHGVDRTRERMLHRRRYRRVFGNNRGTEMKGRPLDPDQHAQEVEAAELNAELALSGAGVYRLSCYLTVGEPGGDGEALAEILDGIGRELAGANDAHLHPGVGAQRDLWRSALPLGVDAAARTRKYVSRNVGDTTPLVGTSCGSPAGIPVGYSSIGRSLQRLDLFDAAHPNHLLVVVGESGSGKTTLVNKLFAGSIARGAQGAVIERGGHYDFLVSLIPGAASVCLGAGSDAICPWDTPDPAHVGPEKIDYLLALHATLIGTGRPEEYGLSALEQSVLGRAIREVYDRCALTGERPRELLLAETLRAWALSETQAGAGQMADLLRDLAARLHNFTGNGPYAYLADRATTIPRDAPLTAFDTAAIPDHFAGAAMFEIVEHLTARAQAAHERHLRDGSSDGGDAYLIALEECWKLMEREATGRWVNELARRARHLRLGILGISQQFSDFDSPWGRALVENTAQTITFRQSPRQIELMRGELGLSTEEAQIVAQHVKTIRRDYASCYWVNGSRGRSMLTVRLGALEYWIATHDPERDEPLRQLALRESRGNPWRALRLLADPDWQQQHAYPQEA